MALSSGLNGTYRPSSVNVTQKYTPLHNILVAGGDSATVDAMINNRITRLGDFGVRANRLTYLGIETIDDAVTNEVGKNPPLVVISSNRSAWIKERYENAKGILEGIQPAVTHFNSVTDVRVLAAGAVPLYLPLRLTAAESNTRNVYIFVASDEYSEYRTNLAGTGITVIGWRTEGDGMLLGFGASRYAAMEFFKYIQRQNNACCRSIWMLDDNTSYIRSFPGLATVEGQLGTLFGLGFKGGTQVHPDSEFTKISKDAPSVPAAAGAHEPAPLLQQTVLWNVVQFNANSFSFSPYFITSAEDSSLTKFLGLARCRFYGGCEIFKGNTTQDNTFKVKVQEGAKKAMLTYCYNMRNTVPFTCSAVGGATNLGQVITAARDAETSPPKITNVAGEESEPQTYSKALEQILSKALENGLHLPAAVFTLPRPPQITSKLIRR